VAWRRDGKRIDTTRHDTKEAAQDFAKALSWVIYYQFAVMCGRETIQKQTLVVPTGMEIIDDLPVEWKQAKFVDEP
jgi:hypothetical protein